MQRRIGPDWSAEQVEAGKRASRAWSEYFTGASRTGPPERAVMSDEAAHIAEVRHRHEHALLRYPNVVAVATGVQAEGGVPTGEQGLVVYVSRKVPADQLDEKDRLPGEIEGVPVDVVESGPIEALSL